MRKYLVGAAMAFIGLIGLGAGGANAAPVSAAANAVPGLQAPATSLEKIDWRPRRYYRGPGRRVVIVRPWHRRPHYGVLIGGIALGAVLAGSYYYAHPAPPQPGLCWYWSSPARSHGYWDYCD